VLKLLYIIQIRFLKAVEAILIPLKTLYLLGRITLKELWKTTLCYQTSGGFSIGLVLSFAGRVGGYDLPKIVLRPQSSQTSIQEKIPSLLAIEPNVELIDPMSVWFGHNKTPKT
jgi:hypothetical protein